MDKVKNILFLTYYYPPQKYPRSIQISHLEKSLKNHFNIKIITSIPKNNNDETLMEFTSLDNVIYTEKSSFTDFIETCRGDKIKKIILPDYAYLWHFDLFHKSIDVIESFKPDIIITFGQPMSSHIAGLKLKKKYPKLKWVAHFSDPWTDNMFNDYNFFTRSINSYYEKNVFLYADNLVFTSTETINLVTKKYQDKIYNKSLCIPHMFDQSLYPTLGVKKNEKFIIRYIGNFYGKRNPDYLFEAVSKLKDFERNSLQIELIGSSDNNIQEKIYNYGLEDLVIQRKSVSYLESLSLMKEADLLIIIDAPSELSPFLPSKLIDYIGANKPIFGITPEGTSKKLIEEMGFLTAHPEKIDEIFRKLTNMINLIKNKKIRKVPEKIKKRFNINNAGNKIFQLII